jgi:hypothetical protein
MVRAEQATNEKQTHSVTFPHKSGKAATDLVLIKKKG